MFIPKKITSEQMQADKLKITWGEDLLEPVEDNEPQQKRLFFFLFYFFLSDDLSREGKEKLCRGEVLRGEALKGAHCRDRVYSSSLSLLTQCDSTY